MKLFSKKNQDGQKLEIPQNLEQKNWQRLDDKFCIYDMIMYMFTGVGAFTTLLLIIYFGLEFYDFCRVIFPSEIKPL